jgi:hypothetical protein
MADSQDSNGALEWMTIPSRATGSRSRFRRCSPSGGWDTGPEGFGEGWINVGGLLDVSSRSLGIILDPGQGLFDALEVRGLGARRCVETYCRG